MRSPTRWALGALLSLLTMPVNAAERTADLDRLADLLDLDPSYTASARDEARNVLEQARTRDLNDAEFFLVAARVVALADNGHTNISSGPIRSEFGLLPIRMVWFSDGPYVVRARSDHEALLGGRVTAIAGMALEEAERRMKAYHGGTVENHRAYYAPYYLLSPPLLRAEGIAPETGPVSVTVRFGDGRELTESLATDPNTAEYRRVPPWRMLHPTPISGEGDQWRTVLDGSSPQPLYLGEPDTDYRYQVIDDSVGYLQLRNNYESDGRSVKSWLRDLERTLRRSPPARMVVDLRQSPGGDLSRTAEFMLKLPELLGEEGRIYVLTGNATFSAAIYSSFFPKAAAPDRTRIVGERVGDRTRFWAESGDPFELPDSGYWINYSLQLHDIGEGCTDRSICHMTRYRDRWNIAVGSLEPDEPIGLDFADYQARRDPPLARALELARSADTSRAP